MSELLEKPELSPPDSTPEMTKVGGSGMHIGFTGTRNHKKVDLDRIRKLTNYLARQFYRGFKIIHHGACLGMDEKVHYLALDIGYNVVVHPPTHTKYMMKFDTSEDKDRVIFLPAKAYLSRNGDIVDSSKQLVAVPSDPETEVLRSGTWATVRYARKRGIDITII